MARLLSALILLMPVAADAAHTGVTTPRTGPEWSDLALFVLAAVAVWQVRRAMRRRFPKD